MKMLWLIPVAVTICTLLIWLAIENGETIRVFGRVVN
jgi:hypothetical protein